MTNMSQYTITADKYSEKSDSELVLGLRGAIDNHTEDIILKINTSKFEK